MIDGDGDGGDGGDADDADDRPDRPALADRRGLAAEVYPPAEDSGLLAAAAVEHARGLVLEVGTGSGWVAERVGERTGCRVIGSDVNPAACRRARGRGVEAVRADLVGPFRAGAVDTVLFNPPYLPTSPDAAWDDPVETALSGGPSGRAVIEPFLASVGRVLRPGGLVLLLVSSLAGYEATVERAREAGFAATVVREESYPFETLSVVRLTPEADG